MKKGPEAVLFGPTPTGCSGGFLAAAPDPLPPPTSFFPADASQDRFRRHFGQSASPSSGRWAKPLLAWGRGGGLKITLLTDTQP